MWMPENVDAKRSWQKMWLRFLPFLALYFLVALGGYYYLEAKNLPQNQFLYWQQRLSQAFLSLASAHFIGIVVLNWKVWREKVLHWWKEPTGPEALALLRIVLFAYLTAFFLFKGWQEWLPLTSLPRSALKPLPYTAWLVEHLPIHSDIYAAGLIIGAILAFLATMGALGRWPKIILIPLVIYLLGLPQLYGKLSHLQFFAWVCSFLAFAPTNDVWGIDAIFRRIRRQHRRPRAQMEYALPLKLAMLSMAGIYFFSGFRKLIEAGFYWFLSDNPVNLLRTEWLEQFEYVPYLRVDHYPLLCSIAAGMVILVELAYPFLLLGSKTRRWLALEILLFHSLNGYFLRIDFTYLKAAHLSYFNVSGHWNWLKAHLRPIFRWLLILSLNFPLGYLTGTWVIYVPLMLMAAFDLSMRSISLRKRVKMMQAIRGRLPRKGKNRQINWVKINLITGLSIVGLNWACGLFGIHSWPFSSYPSYSFLRKSTVEYGWFHPTNKMRQPIDLDLEAKKVNFRKEDILPLSESIARANEGNGTDLEPAVMQAWNRWLAALPALQNAENADVVIQKLSNNPDLSNRVLEEKSIGELKKRDGKWFFEGIAYPN